MFILKPRHVFKVPVEAECISCDVFSGKSAVEVNSLRLWEGNKRRELSELFDVRYEPKGNDDAIRIVGDLSRVKRIGRGMSQGEIMIEGNVGSHLGEDMNGGKISIKGNVGSWLGSAMKGGEIEVFGDAGDYVAAPYRGSTSGMRGGKIIVHGNAGNEVGCFMRDGLLEICGNATQFLGMHMQGGTILVRGDSMGRIGAEMLDGKIIVLGLVPEILPTFTIEDISRRVKVKDERIAGPFYRFRGDLTEPGKGKLYVLKERNMHLSFYEKYL